MLGKLLKNELKHSARYVMTVYACAAAVAVFMLLGMLVKVTWITVLGTVALYIVGFAAVIMTLVSVIKNFYDTLYGKQGYLTFTLPVKCSELLLSKVLISFFWIIMSIILMAVIYLLVILSVRSQADESLGSLIEMIRESGILDFLPSGKMIVEFLILVVFIALLNILVFVGFVYFSVTLANTRALQKHPKLFGFLIFFASYGVLNSIGAKLTYSLPLSALVSVDKIYIAFKAMDSAENVLFAFGLGGTVFMAICSLALLFATGWIMEHKVNIK